MAWTEQQEKEVVEWAMDLATNANRFRQICIICITNDGEMVTLRKREDNASSVETVGMLTMALRREKKLLNRMFEPSDNPLREDDE